MKNQQLAKDLKGILENQTNISNINKVDVGGKSINIEYNEPLSSDTYVYYEKENDRDADFDELQIKIKEANAEKTN